PDVFHDLVGRCFPVLSLPSHHHSLSGYDEPETLSNSITHICPKGADAGHLEKERYQIETCYPPDAANFILSAPVP
ncbi:MAG: hypothetical protein ACTSSR_04480, partial [Alphaproteobacteria bacterium]